MRRASGWKKKLKGEELRIKEEQGSRRLGVKRARAQGTTDSRSSDVFILSLVSIKSFPVFEYRWAFPCFLLHTKS